MEGKGAEDGDGEIVMETALPEDSGIGPQASPLNFVFIIKTCEVPFRSLPSSGFLVTRWHSVTLGRARVCPV